MLVRTTILLVLSCLLLSFQASASDKLEIQLSLPKLNVNPYHRPYVAIWLETPKRQLVTTLALWADDKEWYKDLRQWWRKAGRSKQAFDSVTGATKKPGNYTINWNGLDTQGNAIPPGEYVLKIEASREEGGREYLKTKLTINQQGQFKLKGKTELGPISIKSFH